ncbi:type II secretion system F family protein [Luteolibacter flavescens]|uniref:Type II secretion system F family protein n=1 Tax=Luteolibacter flavescens TaxID=1859460 RepID=A0ABT3FMN7_9BACT|nr:type II secretion system F family protein [Luteolibacter flavescens]MCW1884464.1 type II secretion system F family protein [Luteolibacter flavescens]
MSSASVTAKPGKTAAPAGAAGKPPAAAQGSFSFLKPAGAKPFTKKQLVAMFRGLASMLRAQINTADALKYYGQGLQDKPMADALMKIREEINAGVTVHEAFRRTGRFSDMVVGLIQAGSDAGQLHQAFGALATRFTSEMIFTKAIRKATVMPCAVISVLLGAFIFSQVSIVPQVQDMLKSVSQKPDGMTAIAFKVSAITKAVWPFVVTGIIASAITIWRSEKVRNIILGIAMSKWRLLRLMIMSLRQMTFLSTMKMLHANGINLAKSIRVSANSVKGTPFYQELRDAADKYEHSGVPLSTAFSKYTSVDSQVVHMMSIGEKSASLDSQLDMLSTMYEEDAQNYMTSFTAAVNFLVLIIAVGLIAAVFIGTFLPIFLMGPKMMNSKM